MKAERTKNITKEQIADFCMKNQIRKFAFYGSVLRDDFGPDSDIDVLVELCAVWDSDFEQLLPVVRGLTEFAVIFRYPEEWSDDAAAERALVQAEEVRLFVCAKLGLD